MMTVVVVISVVLGVPIVMLVSEVALFVVILVVVIRDPVCAGAVIDTFVEVLTIGMRVDVLIIVSDATSDLCMDALTEIIRTVLTNIGVGVLVDVNLNAFAGVTTAFEFVASDPLE